MQGAAEAVERQKDSRARLIRQSKLQKTDNTDNTDNIDNRLRTYITTTKRSLPVKGNDSVRRRTGRQQSDCAEDVRIFGADVFCSFAV